MLRRLPLLLAVCVLTVVGLSAGSANGDMVTVLGHNGRTHVVDNPYLSGPTANPDLPVAPAVGPILALPSPGTPFATAAAVTTKKKKKPKKKPKPVTFADALLKLSTKGALTAAAYSSDLRAWRQALTEEKHLTKWRATQLTGATNTLSELAADKQVTIARLPVLMLTLADNARYWATGPALANGAPVQFQGSELVWEYYAGVGIQLQVLHTFGEGDGYYEAGRADYPKLETLISEMLPLAIRRGGGLAWEYYFNWQGGNPPWVSAMAQGTGLEAFTDAYLATGNRQYLTDAHDALPLLQTPPPDGVAVKTSLGTRYLQYSFTPRTDIINAFLETLIGLYDYQQVSLDPVAAALYKAGNAQAQAELKSFIIGGWSLYQPGQADSYSYHVLVTGFLKLLCEKTQIPVYCSTYQTFEADLLSQPQLTLNTTSATAGKKFNLAFTTTKYAAVGVTLSQGGKNYLYTKQGFDAGTNAFATPKLKAGTYDLAMSITDGAGHYRSLTAQLQVCKQACSLQTSAFPPTTGTVPKVTVPIPKPSKPLTPVGTTTTPTTTTPPPTTTTLTTVTPPPPPPTGTTTTGGGGISP